MGSPLFGLRRLIYLRACLPYADVTDYEIYHLNILIIVFILPGVTVEI